jgi:hypothetical protein
MLRGAVPSVSARKRLHNDVVHRDVCNVRLLCRGYLQVTAFIRAKNEIAGRVPGDFFKWSKEKSVRRQRHSTFTTS